MLRAVEIVAQIAPRAFPNYTRAFDAGDAAFAAAGLTTPLRLAHFLAQALHETGGGTVLFESLAYRTPARLLQIFGVGNHTAAIRPEEVDALLGNEQALAERVYGLGNPRKARELGNTLPGDGYRYRGGGLLQTTGRANYKHMGDLCGTDFESTPTLIVDPAHALGPALGEWTQGHLNDAADRNDLHTITRVINGGTNGLAERQALFDQIWTILGTDSPEPWRTATDNPDTRWLQETLNHLGTTPLLLVDGKSGPATTTALKTFQSHHNLTPDGTPGPLTIAALKSALAAT
jgi:putative chitinase